MPENLVEVEVSTELLSLDKNKKVGANETS